VALYVRGVGVVPSPLWMQRRLQHAGMRPINLIVDATNYAMLENGQPVHAYDERDVKNRMIEVRRARAGETLITLDGHERTLIPTDIVIADAKNAIGLAGIMGGQNSEVKADTQNIIIEAAHFNASLIRKTAKRFALHTEASHRFERGIDIDHVAWVARRVADLIHRGASELKAEGVSVGLPEIAARLVDVQTEAKPARNILLRMSRLQKLTALTDVGAPEAKAILGRLGFRLLEEQGDQLRFAIPGWRQDMEREVDLIEEVARVHGYDKIPFKLPAMEIGTKPEHPLIEFTDLNKITLATHGLTEVISFPSWVLKISLLARFRPSIPWQLPCSLPTLLWISTVISGLRWYRVSFMLSRKISGMAFVVLVCSRSLGLSTNRASC
jgi:phenylalanyl-tRNA synthetase beta chain